MNKSLARIAELLAEAQQIFPGLSEDSQRQIATSAFIEENSDRRSHEIEANNERRHQERNNKGYSKPFVTAASKQVHIGEYKPSPQAVIPGLDNVSRDLTGKLEIKKETEKGSLVCSVGGTDFWIFPSAATLLTNAKFYKSADVKAKVQERAFKDGKKYWQCIALDVNPDDDVS